MRKGKLIEKETWQRIEGKNMRMKRINTWERKEEKTWEWKEINTWETKEGEK